MPTRDWSVLFDAFGPANQTPELLAALTSGSERSRQEARDALLERYGAEEPVSGLPEVARELVAVVAQADGVDRHRNLLLLVDLVTGDPDLAMLESFHGKAARAARTPHEEGALVAFEGIATSLVAGLAGDDPLFRAACAFAAPFLAEPPKELIAALDVAAGATTDAVRTSALLALATMARDGREHAAATFARRVEQAAAPVAALSRFVAGERHLPAEALVLLAEGLTVPPSPRAEQPWGGGDLGDSYAAVLRAHGASARVALPAVLDAVERERDRAQMRDASLALSLLLGAPRTIVPSALDAAQRSALLRLAHADVSADFRSYGLPDRASELVRLLEPEAGATTSPVETALAVGGHGDRPVWQWFSAVFEGKVEAAVLLAALVERFSPTELLAVLRDATRGAFDSPLPPMALVEAALAHTGDEPSAFLELADETLALDPVRCAPPTALLVVLPLARHGLLAAKHDRLVALALRGNDRAVVARLEALLGAELVGRLGRKKRARSGEA